MPRAATPRLGICLDSCHLYASGYDIREPDGMTAVVDECFAAVGKDRLGSLHLNDSAAGLGSNRDRHANLGEGELGRRGLRDVPERAALRRPPVRDRDPGQGAPGPRSRRGPAGLEFAETGNPETPPPELECPRGDPSPRSPAPLGSRALPPLAPGASG